jgi:hypothetical protein
MQITCPACGHQQALVTDESGLPMPCEACGQPIPAPAEAGIQEGLPPATSRSTREERRDSDRENMPRRRDAGSSAGMVIALVVGGVLVLFFILCGVGAIAGGFFAFLGVREERRAVMAEVAVAKAMDAEAKAVAKPDVKVEPKLPIIPPDRDAKAPADPLERLRNGDFEQGHKGFRTQYGYSPGNVRPELAYDILANPQAAHPDAPPFGDHTNGKGKMLLVNGGHAIDQLVWGQTTDVRPDAEYTFSLWVASWTPISPAQLDVRINGKSIGQVAAPQQVGQWTELTMKWNAGDAKAAAIEIYDINQGFAGNDFALDDISLRGPAAK